MDYMPTFSGTICARYEWQTATDEQRFQVRNARLAATGNVLPIVAYKLEIDLSDRGEIKMLDAYTRIFPVRNFDFTIGQMRVPFTIDAHRSPHLRYFANRSFIAKQVGNARDVGVALGYDWKDGPLPLIVQGGVFNGTGLYRQNEWRKSLNYSIRAQLLFAPGWNLTLGNQRQKPQNVSMQLFDVGMYYQGKRLHVEAEYLLRTYAKDAFKNTNAINSFAVYRFPIKGFFHAMSVLMRYDYMSDQSTGIYEDDELKVLTTADHNRHRITGGVTLHFAKKVLADIRINYEQYFYKKTGVPKNSEQNKLVIEFMTHF